MCQHLEIDEFGTYSILSEGRTQVVMLQRCSSCKKFLAMDGSEINEKTIVNRVNTTKAKMRTLTAQINSELYDKLQRLVENETDGGDSSKIMSEIVALGMKQYGTTLKASTP